MLIRKLEGIECKMSLAHNMFSGTTQACQSFVVNRIIDEHSINVCAKILFNRYQSLRLNIKKINNDYYAYDEALFCKIPIIYMLESNKNFNEIFNTSVNNPIFIDKQTWRIEACADKNTNQTLIIFCVSHVIVQSEGMFELADLFFESLDMLNQGVHTPKTYDIPFNNSLENSLKNQTKTSLNDPKLSNEYMMHLANSLTVHRTTKSNKIKIINRDYKLLSNCASNLNIKLNSLLVGIISDSLFNYSNIDVSQNISTAISLKNIMIKNSDQSAMGCFVAVSTVPLRIDSGAVEISREYEGLLMKDMFSNLIYKNSVDISKAENNLNKLIDNDEFNYGFGVTNLGEIVINLNYKTFKIIDYDTYVNRNIGTYIFVAHVYELKHELIINLVYVTPCISKEFILGIANNIKNKIDQLIMRDTLDAR